MQATAQQILFSGERPETLDMLGLMDDGLAPEHLTEAWTAAGREVPCLDLLMHEVSVFLPYVGTAVKSLLATHNPAKESLLFAARDAENMYDLARVISPDANAKLMPASSYLWRNTDWDHMPDEAAYFLASHDVDHVRAAAPDYLYRLIDTGFAGTIGGSLANAAKKVLDADIRKKLTISLICRTAFQAGIATKQIIPDQVGDYPYQGIDLPLTGTIIDASGEFGGDSRRPSFRCAVALQCMPRYHGSYGTFDPSVKPCASHAETQLDHPWLLMNTNLVNPYAAAVTQMAFIRYAQSIA